MKTTSSGSAASATRYPDIHTLTSDRIGMAFWSFMLSVIQIVGK
jgi:hypothetical protein